MYSFYSRRNNKIYSISHKYLLPFFVEEKKQVIFSLFLSLKSRIFPGVLLTLKNFFNFYPIFVSFLKRCRGNPRVFGGVSYSCRDNPRVFGGVSYSCRDDPRVLGGASYSCRLPLPWRLAWLRALCKRRVSSHRHPSVDEERKPSFVRSLPSVAQALEAANTISDNDYGWRS
jgi:hypothetical protein